MFFIILLPFFTFATLSWLTPVMVSLLAAAAVALALIARERCKGESVKLTNIVAVAVFGGFGVSMLLTHIEWNATSVRMALDAALVIAVLTSIALRFPFTLQYSREQSTPEAAAHPEFMRVNYVLTWAWAGAFALMLVADVASQWWPSAPLWSAVAVAFAVRNVVVQFTKWYTDRARKRYAEIGAGHPTA